MSQIAQTTKRRASFAVGTVWKRMSTCGSPAVPSTSAMPRERKSHGFAPYCSPGARIASPFAETATALSRRVLRVKPLRARTQIVIAKAPAMRSTALTICTQVVPFMPPMRT